MVDETDEEFETYSQSIKLPFKIIQGQDQQQLDEIPEQIDEQLRALTYQNLQIGSITQGTYIMEEKDLPESYQELLHGRAYIIDRTQITQISQMNPISYYIAADKVQGLIIPARTLFIKSENSDGYYRFTDDGERWTDWITMEDGMGHTYLPQEQCRFAEVQVYADQTDAIITLRATR